MSPAGTPGTWYDLSSRLDAVAAVIDSIPMYAPTGDAYRLAQHETDCILNLTAAARDILTLAKSDCEALEQYLSH